MVVQKKMSMFKLVVLWCCLGSALSAMMHGDDGNDRIFRGFSDFLNYEYIFGERVENVAAVAASPIIQEPVAPAEQEVIILEQGFVFPSNDRLRSMCIELRAQAFLTLYLHLLEAPRSYRDVKCFSIRTENNPLLQPGDPLGVLVGILLTSNAMCQIPWDEFDACGGRFERVPWEEAWDKTQQIQLVMKALRLHGFTLTNFLANYGDSRLPSNLTHTSSIDSIFAYNQGLLEDCLTLGEPTEESELIAMWSLREGLGRLEPLIKQGSDVNYPTLLFHLVRFFMAHQLWLKSMQPFKKFYDEVILPNNATWELREEVESWEQPNLDVIEAAMMAAMEHMLTPPQGIVLDVQVLIDQPVEQEILPRSEPILPGIMRTVFITEEQIKKFYNEEILPYNAWTFREAVEDRQLPSSRDRGEEPDDEESEQKWDQSSGNGGKRFRHTDQWKNAVLLMYVAGVAYEAMVPVLNEISPGYVATVSGNIAPFIRNIKKKNAWCSFLNDDVNAKLAKAPESVHTAIKNFFAGKEMGNRKFRAVLDECPKLLDVHNKIRAYFKLPPKNFMMQ